MNNKLISILKEQNDYISGEELGQKLGVSRTAVWKNINKLKQMGYKIDAVTNKGYKLLDSDEDILNENEITLGLKTSIMGNQVYCMEETTSTNDEARILAENGCKEGALVVAENQTMGRGRRGKPWRSEKGSGIWMSLLLRPDVQPSEAPKITLVAGLAICRAIIKVTGIDAGIKWPNDILVGNKKVCGILTDMSAEMTCVNYVIVGVGVNVNTESFPDEIADIASSLKIIGGKKYNRSSIIKAFLEEFEKYYMYIINNNFKGFIEEYKKNSVIIGKRVTVYGKESFEADAVDISNEGELIVKKDNGEMVTIFSGEVSIRSK